MVWHMLIRLVHINRVVFRERRRIVRHVLGSLVTERIRISSWHRVGRTTCTWDLDFKSTTRKAVGVFRALWGVVLRKYRVPDVGSFTQTVDALVFAFAQVLNCSNGIGIGTKPVMGSIIRTCDYFHVDIRIISRILTRPGPLFRYSSIVCKTGSTLQSVS